MEEKNGTRVAFTTLGCKTNQYDTQAMKEQFLYKGYDIVNEDSFADYYIINSCTVTNLADRKSRGAIQKAKRKNPKATIVVVGCYPQRDAAEVLAINEVDIVAGTAERGKIVEIIEDYDFKSKINAVKNIDQHNNFENLKISNNHDRTRAVLKIQDGCDQSCSYCIIPKVRGQVRSRDSIDIVSEAKTLVASGFREIVLTGIHIASYGKDLSAADLPRLLAELSEVEGLTRIRLGSVDPSLLTKQFIEVLRGFGKVCPHFHVSLQSGSDKILSLMKRRYTAQQYYEKIDWLRSNIKNAAITTDVMVGFPGESEMEFSETYDFVKKVEFSKIHVFKYSERKGTAAELFTDKVSDLDKEKRAKRLINLGKELETTFMQKYIGENVDVLIEEQLKNQQNQYMGYSENYLKVVVSSKYDLSGKIIKAVPEKLENGVLLAKIT